MAYDEITLWSDNQVESIIIISECHKMLKQFGSTYIYNVKDEHSNTVYK